MLTHDLTSVSLRKLNFTRLLLYYNYLLDKYDDESLGVLIITALITQECYVNTNFTASVKLAT